MIPFDFDYYKPKSLGEAYQLHEQLREDGKEPLYFSGGTEIITLGRLNLLYTKAVIDIKDIPECQVIRWENNQLYLGAARSLTDIEDENPFPLLTNASKEVADHTARTKITLGGNVCANIFYREAVLPFLLANSDVITYGSDGTKKQPINQIFNEILRLEQSELLVQIITDRRFISAPYINIKRRKQWVTGYPVVTVAAMLVDDSVRVAISGLCPYPFRSEKVEDVLNESTLPIERRVDLALNELPQPILTDSEASSDYRLFVLKNTLLDVCHSLRGDSLR